MTISLKKFRFGNLSLPSQFLLAGGAVMVTGMYLAGGWVAERVERAVVQNAATSSAMFMESFMSPVAAEMSSTEGLSDPSKYALSVIFHRTAIGQRIISYRIWDSRGFVTHRYGEKVGSHPHSVKSLANAWTGKTQAWFGEIDVEIDRLEQRQAVLAVYTPIRQPWSTDVSAVVEFYEDGVELEAEIAEARLSAWQAIGGIFLVSYALLYGIVVSGGRTIRRQKFDLAAQLQRTQAVLEVNEGLRRRVIAASARASAESERLMRRIGFELHDGPAQHVAFAALRLDSIVSGRGTEKDGPAVKQSLDKALEELRIISRGLSLPDLDRMPLTDITLRLCRDIESQTGLRIDLRTCPSFDHPLDYAQKLCIFRFLQETLANTAKHARVEEARVTCNFDGQNLVITVKDEGIGFDGLQSRSIRSDGGQGLFSLIDRAESIGGTLTVDTSPGNGSQFTLLLPLDYDSAQDIAA